MNMKLEIKLLHIFYAIFFILGFVLFFHYTNQKKIEQIEEPKYYYNIISVEEENDSVIYKVNINDEYEDDILISICEEIKKDYINIYSIEHINDKANKFEIIFYYNNNQYKIMSNN